MLMGVYYIVIESSYQWLIVMFIGILLSILGGDIGTHRYLAHRSFKTGPIRDSILKILSVKNCLGSPMTWAIIHRYHHINSDTSGDPHFPDGIKSWLTLWNPSSPWWDIKISPRPKDC
ncbi:uncharacterized protein METZ01_LOCUS375215, partial [marine metagenome]